MNQAAQPVRRPSIIAEPVVARFLLLSTMMAFFPPPLHMSSRALLDRVAQYIFIRYLWWVRTALKELEGNRRPVVNRVRQDDGRGAP